MTLIKICSGKGRFSQSGGSFFQNFPWHVGPNHGGSSYVTKYLAAPLFQTCRRPCKIALASPALVIMIIWLLWQLSLFVSLSLVAWVLRVFYFRSFDKIKKYLNTMVFWVPNALCFVYFKDLMLTGKMAGAFII